MFGFGKKKAYHEKVRLLIEDLQFNDFFLTATMNPVNSQIEQARLNSLSEHEATLALGYSVAIEYFNTDRRLQGENLLRRLEDFGDNWVNSRVADSSTVKGFRNHFDQQVIR